MDELDSEEELLRRFPEINRISGSLRHETVQTFLDHCPPYFWTAPASSTGKYHPDDHSGRYGLFLHTKRAFSVFEDLAPSYLNQGKLQRYEVNAGRAAILLHDLYKYGEPPRGTHTETDHDRIAAMKLREKTDLPDIVLKCVDSHNGPWGGDSSNNPESDLEQLHHLADMVASRVNIPGIAVYRPCQELEEEFERLNSFQSFD